MINDLLNRYRRKDRRALARLLSLAARGQALTEINAALPETAPNTRVIAFTGSGGVGKSSLIGRLLDVAVKEGQRVAVLACDPESPKSGGALLGDRVRMGSRGDDGVFIRSLATPGGSGAVAQHLDLLIRLLATFGFDVVFLETVGAGQGDVSVGAWVDVVVLLLQPETGDDLQWEKAGVLEVADIIAIHKADLPGAEQTAAQVKNSLALTDARAIPVILASSQSGQGMDELWQAIQACPQRSNAFRPTVDEILRLVQPAITARLRAALTHPTAELTFLCQRWQRREMSEEQFVHTFLRLLVDGDPLQ